MTLLRLPLQAPPVRCFPGGSDFVASERRSAPPDAGRSNGVGEVHDEGSSEVRELRAAWITQEEVLLRA